MSYHRNCQLSSATYTETYLPDILPGSTLWTRLKRSFQTLIIASPRHFETYDYLKSQLDLQTENKRQVEKYPYIVHPLSMLGLSSDIILSIEHILSLCYVPFFVTFFEFISVQVLYCWNIIDIICTIITTLEIFLNFFTGYIVRQTNEIVLDRRSICKKYLYTGFIFDLCTTIPIVTILYYTRDSKFHRNYLYGLFGFYVYILCVARLCKLNKYLQKFTKASGMNQNHLTLTRLLLETMYLLHFSCCFRYLLVHLEAHAISANREAYPEYSLDYYNCSRKFINETVRQNFRYSSMHQLYHHFILEIEASKFNTMTMSTIGPISNTSSLMSEYMRSFLYTLKIVTTSGFRIEGIDKLYNVIFCYWTLVSGFLWTTYVMLSWMQMRATTEISLNKFEAYHDQILNYCNLKRISGPLRRRILRYYKHKYRGRYFNEAAINDTLSTHLKREILMHCCHSLLTSVEIFRDLPKAIIQEIIDVMKPELFLPNDVIVQAGSEGNSMYLIQYGTAVVMTSNGKEYFLILYSTFGNKLVCLYRGNCE